MALFFQSGKRGTPGDMGPPGLPGPPGESSGYDSAALAAMLGQGTSKGPDPLSSDQVDTGNLFNTHHLIKEYHQLFLRVHLQN